jgi:hypothetical protein
MTGPVPKPVTATVGGDSFRIWEKDRARVTQDIVEGRPFDAFISERGRFDAMFDFLLRSGLWTAATEMRPSGLKKDNGIPYRLLNGVECLREMAGIDTPANCGPLLKDSYLLERIGFTAEKIEKHLARDRTVIDPESLLNHLDRFTEQDLEAGFLQHVEVIRHKRWLRGGVYAVDGHDILIPYGQGYEGARRISQGAYGYKLLMLLNIQDGCELIVGYILGGLQESEITMLRRMLARLDQTMGPLRQWLKILLMDRGYWGTDLFCELSQKRATRLAPLFFEIARRDHPPLRFYFRFFSNVFRPLFHGRFGAILFSVCNHLGDLLGVGLRSDNFANFCFTPIFTGSPNGSLRFHPHAASSRGA